MNPKFTFFDLSVERSRTRQGDFGGSRVTVACAGGAAWLQCAAPGNVTLHPIALNSSERVVAA
jgi:hypothetical protein